MSVELLMYAAALFLVGLGFFLLGYASGIKSQKTRDEKYIRDTMPKTVGTLLIETTDPDGPYLFVDLNVPVDEVGSHKKVAMDVQTNGPANSRD